VRWKRPEEPKVARCKLSPEQAAAIEAHLAGEKPPEPPEPEPEEEP
jgi:hypothetical protein